MGYLAAGLIAAALAAVQLLLRLESRPTKGALPWWTMYLGIEVFFGAVAYGALDQIVADNWAGGFWGWLMAGTSAAAILRLRITELRGSGDVPIPVGPAFFYEILREFFERQIDNIGATEQANWIAGRLIPQLSDTAPTVIGPLIEGYVRSSGKLTQEKKDETVAFISETLAETSSGDRAKREALIWSALDVGGWRLLRRLYRLK